MRDPFYLNLNSDGDTTKYSPVKALMDMNSVPLMLKDSIPHNKQPDLKKRIERALKANEGK